MHRTLSSAFPPHVARWAEDKAVLRRNLAEVQGVSAGLIAGIDEEGLSE